MKYAFVIERARRNFSAYVPDLPGCIATGKTLPEIRRRIRQAIEFHIDGLRLEGLRVPKPASLVGFVKTARA